VDHGPVVADGGRLNTTTQLAVVGLDKLDERHGSILDLQIDARCVEFTRARRGDERQDQSTA